MDMKVGGGGGGGVGGGVGGFVCSIDIVVVA